MPTIYDADPQELIEQAAEGLKKIEAIKPPVWAGYVKTGVHKEKPPVKKDWWYVRAASVLRMVYRFGPIGVSKLRRKYSGKKNRGVKPERHYKGSGSIARKILQQLEKAELVKKSGEGIHKGRVLTPKGISFLDKIATEIAKSSLKPTETAPTQKVVKKERKPAPKTVEKKTVRSKEPKAKQEEKSQPTEKPKSKGTDKEQKNKQEEKPKANVPEKGKTKSDKAGTAPKKPRSEGTVKNE